MSLGPTRPPDEAVVTPFTVLYNKLHDISCRSHPVIFQKPKLYLVFSGYFFSNSNNRIVYLCPE